MIWIKTWMSEYIYKTFGNIANLFISAIWTYAIGE